MAHIGVKNRTKVEQSLQYNGKVIVFAPDQTRIVEGIPFEFITGIVHTKHKTRARKMPDGEVIHEQLPHLVSEHLFEVVPLAEALQKAQPDEDPKVIEARKKAGAAAEERKKLMDEIKAELKADGWQPPSEKQEDKKGKKVEKGGKEAA